MAISLRPDIARGPGRKSLALLRSSYQIGLRGLNERPDAHKSLRTKILKRPTQRRKLQLRQKYLGFRINRKRTRYSAGPTAKPLDDVMRSPATAAEFKDFPLFVYRRSRSPSLLCTSVCVCRVLLTTTTDKERETLNNWSQRP